MLNEYICSDQHGNRYYLAPDLLAVAFAVGTLARLAGVTGSSLLWDFGLICLSLPFDEREMTLHKTKSNSSIVRLCRRSDVPVSYPCVRVMLVH